MSKSQGFAEWAEGQAVRDTMTGETGCVVGTLWAFKEAYEVRMDGQWKICQYTGDRLPVYRMVADNGRFQPVG